MASSKTIEELATELTIAWIEARKTVPPAPAEVCEAYETFYKKIIDMEEEATSR